MRKLGSGGLKWLKIFHLIFIVLMLGGIISSLAIRYQLELNSLIEVTVFYQILKTISDHVIRYGAQGIIVTGLIYSIWTKWGFYKYKWVAAKWLIFIGQTVLGIFFVDRWMEQNISMLASAKATALTNNTFINNQTFIFYGATAQITLTILLIVISVIKPWNIKRN